MAHPNPPLPPLTPLAFSGVNYNGIDLVEDEAAIWVITYGHIDKHIFAEAVIRMDQVNAGPAYDDYGYAAEEVELAMSPASLTGFQSWLEARRPGTDWSR